MNVPAGLHLCYGDYGHHHLVEPASLAMQIRVLDKVTAGAPRAVSFTSFTVPQYQRDPAYFSRASRSAKACVTSNSGLPGQTVMVTVAARADTIRVEVTDRSGPGVPRLRPAGHDAEAGRGLGLVAGLAAQWGGSGLAGER